MSVELGTYSIGRHENPSIIKPTDTNTILQYGGPIMVNKGKKVFPLFRLALTLGIVKISYNQTACNKCIYERGIKHLAFIKPLIAPDFSGE